MYCDVNSKQQRCSDIARVIFVGTQIASCNIVIVNFTLRTQVKKHSITIESEKCNFASFAFLSFLKIQSDNLHTRINHD